MDARNELLLRLKGEVVVHLPARCRKSAQRVAVKGAAVNEEAHVRLLRHVVRRILQAQRQRIGEDGKITAQIRLDLRHVEEAFRLCLPKRICRKDSLFVASEVALDVVVTDEDVAAERCTVKTPPVELVQRDDERKACRLKHLAKCRLILQGKKRRQNDDAFLLRHRRHLLQSQGIDALLAQRRRTAVDQSLDRNARLFQRCLELLAKISCSVEKDIPMRKRRNIYGTAVPPRRHSAPQIGKSHSLSTSLITLQGKALAVLFHTPRHPAAYGKMIAHDVKQSLGIFVVGKRHAENDIVIGAPF